MEWNNVKWIAFGDSLTDDTGECGTKAPNKYHKLIGEATGASVTVLGKGNTGYYTLADQNLAFYQRMSAAVADSSVNIVTIFGSVNDHAIYNGWTTVAGIQMPDYKLSAGKIASSGLNLSFGDLGNENAPSDSDISAGVAKLALTDTISGGDTTFVAYVNECINLAHSKFPNAKIVLVNEIAGLDLRAGQIKKNIAIKEAIVKKRRAAGDTWLSLFRLNSCRFDGIADSARQYVNAMSGSGLSFDNGQIENADFRAYYTYDNRLHPNDLYNRLWLAPMFANILAESLGITSIPSSLSVSGYNISSLWLDGTPDAPSGDIPSAPEEPVYPSAGGYLYRIDGTAIPLGGGCDCDPNAGGVVSGSISGDTITLENKDGTTVSIPGIPQAGGVVSGSVSDNSLTLNNKDGSTAVIQLPQSGGDFSEVERKLKFLYELTRGQAWDYETDSAEAYSKAIPSGAKMASVNAIGGRSFKYNQVFDWQTILDKYGTSSPGFNFSAANGTVQKNNSGFVYTVTAVMSSNLNRINISSSANGNIAFPVKQGNKYLYVACVNPTKQMDISIQRFGFAKETGANATIIPFTSSKVSGGAWTTWAKILTANYSCDAGGCDFRMGFGPVDASAAAGDTCEIKNVQWFDLTSNFGSGSEPATVEAAIAAYKSLGIDITQPQPYDPGSIKHTAVTEVVTRGKNLLDFTTVITETFGGVLGNDGYYTVGHSSGKTLWENTANIKGVLKVTYNVENASTQRQFYVKALYTDGTTVNFYVWESAHTGFTTDPTKTVSKFVVSYGASGQYRIKDIMVTTDLSSDYTPYHAPITQPIPSAVLALPGYGWSAGTASNRIYRDGNKWFYKQEVGGIDLDTKTIGNYESGAAPFKYFNVANANAKSSAKLLSLDNNIVRITQNGETQIRLYYEAGKIMSEIPNPTGMLYYELAEPIVIDITGLMLNALGPVDVEAGGSITFESESKAAVPNEVEFLLKLSEVG